MGYQVEFKRIVYVDDESIGKDNPTEEEVISAAIKVWNEGMELSDIMMDESHVVKVTKEE